MKSIGPLVALAFGVSTSHLFAEQPGSTPPATTFESGETQTSLIELFTSEGCSSCPPAEKWLSTLKSNPDLWKRTVPVAFHVDYWNHLGWRDRFSKPEFTSRQQRYAARWDGDSVYTPGFVLNGREWRDWFSGNALPASSKKVGSLRVTLTDDGKVNATFVAESPQPRGLALNVALLGNDLESDVKRGENSGRKLRHDFAALSFAEIDMKHEANRWTGSVTLPKQSGNDKPSALAVWITENAIPIQATGGWLAVAGGGDAGPRSGVK
ncbi:MAG TPA: DUF1223 domain-containing protein [Candidatus Binatia bacterium]|nr:DUF1223 domain-containing protein [Candidatus Binatia bacterium]